MPVELANAVPEGSVEHGAARKAACRQDEIIGAQLRGLHLADLRQRLDEGFDQPVIETVRGAGFRLLGESA